MAMGRWAQVQVQPTLVLGMWHACREKACPCPSICLAAKTYWPQFWSHVATDQQETLRACQVFLQQATLSALGPLPGTRGVTVRFVQLALSFPVLLSSLPRIMS